jgi:hypothetical protein
MPTLFAGVLAAKGIPGGTPVIDLTMKVVDFTSDP